MKWGFHPAAEFEHLDHIAFYEDRRTGLGARYLAAFEATLARICEDAGLAAADLRCAGNTTFDQSTARSGFAADVELMEMLPYERQTDRLATSHGG